MAAQPSTQNATHFLIDDLIRKGNTHAARVELERACHARVPRDQRVILASLARRAGLPWLGLRMLSPVIRPPERKAIRASDAEKAEYADCLTKIGAPDEALEWLRGLDNPSAPPALLFTASALIHQWRYAEAAEILSRFVETPGLDPYQRQVGEINLAAALVYEEQYLRARALLARLIDDTRAAALWRLMGNAVLLSAENEILSGEWKAAHEALALAESLTRKNNAMDAFLVAKWSAVLRLKEHGPSEPALRELGVVRQRAVQKEHWETVRDCDRFRACALGDYDLARQLYHGTPFASFREKLARQMSRENLATETYTWSLGSGAMRRLDLTSGRDEDGGLVVKPGQGECRLLRILSSDFYRPFRLASLHHLLFAGEFFNPLSSPDRVHRALLRLRRALETRRFPLGIAEHEGAYRLVADGACALVVPLDNEGIDRDDYRCQELRKKFGDAPFVARQAAEVLHLELRGAQWVLRRAVAGGKLTREGKGPSTCYRFR